MKFKDLAQVSNMSLNQLQVLYSTDELNDIVDFQVLFIRLLNDLKDIPKVKDEGCSKELQDAFKGMMDAPKLAPPPSFIEFNRKCDEYARK